MTYEKKQEKNKLIYSVVVTKEEFEEYCKEALLHIGQEIELKGFRKGHVPAEIVKANVEPSHILSHAVEECISAKWVEIVNKENIEAIKEPNIEVLKMAEGNPLEFKAEVEILPEVKLPDYKKIATSVPKSEAKIEEKDYEGAIKWLLESRAKFSQKDGVAEKGDLIEITYFSKDLEEKKDRFILGKGHFFEGLEDGLLGLKREDQKEIEVTKEKEKTLIKVIVNSIQKMEIPELNDEFAKTVGFTSEKELEKNVREGLLKEKELSEKQQRRTEILEKIAKETNLEVPETLIERENQGLLNNLKERVSYELQITFEEYLKQVKKTEEQVKKEFENVAKERVKGFLILHQIEKQENIVASEEEVNKKIEEIASQYGDKEKTASEMKNSNARFYVEDEIKREKIFNILGC